MKVFLAVTMAMNALACNITEFDIKCELARRDFFSFCQMESPEYYTDEKHHLKRFCTVLQALYEGRIVKINRGDDWTIVDRTPERGAVYNTCRRLMNNLPPRHGKSRTLVNFTAWVLGKNNNERIITCSYNDDEAQEFSKYTRDLIMEQKSPVNPTDIVYSDIFPGTRVKSGDSSYKKWALDGQFFNYKGAGLGGSLTGKGGTVLIIDDPIKDAEVAYSETTLEKIYRWYTGTFLSRKEEGAIEIINHTRWSKNDPCGKILDSDKAEEWYSLVMEVYDAESDRMLCPTSLSWESYEYLRSEMDKAVFMANYHQQPIDIVGRLYKDLQIYHDLPMDEEGRVVFDDIISYTDTADQGNDWLCSLVGLVYRNEIYIIDVLYTKDGMEITEPATAKMLVMNRVYRGVIESNSGGRGFARNVERIIHDEYNTKSVTITWHHQTENKIARIRTNATYVMNHVYFPHNWSVRWPQFFRDITGYLSDKTSKHDDAPDALTGLVEMVNGPSFEFVAIGPDGAANHNPAERKVQEFNELFEEVKIKQMFRT